MRRLEEAELLRVFVGESDRHEGQPLYEAIVLAARREHLAGATVLRGVMGYGAHSRLHASKVLRLSDDMPLVVEVVASPERIAAFLPVLAAMAGDALVTLERVRVVGGKA